MGNDFHLFHACSECSVRAMRVLIKTDTVSDGPATVNHAPEQLDARDTEATRGDTVARAFPILRGFLSSLSDEESPFSIIGHKLWSAGGNLEPDPIVFASRVDLTISHGAQSLDRHQYEDFAAGLAKLLEREPGDALCVELQIISVRFPGGRQGLSLRILLVARGAGRDQAQLRWSLGLARVQQALLFEARALRQGRF
jgi:hypothetical protein